MAQQVYHIVTALVCNLLRAGTIPWRQPWTSSSRRPQDLRPRNLVSAALYRGVNRIILGAAGYAEPHWLTYRQAQARGGHVRRGEHGWPVVYWRILEQEDRQHPGKVKKIPLLRYYTVFNALQCEGLRTKTIEPVLAPTWEPIARAEAIVSALPAPRPRILVTPGEDQACYVPLLDTVRMPAPERFPVREHYYSVLFHELTHATGHPARLNRPDLRDYGSGAGCRPREELTAEMGACFLSAECGIERETIPQSASYIATWLGALGDDPRLVVEAGSRAQAAADWVLGRAETKAGPVETQDVTSEAA